MSDISDLGRPRHPLFNAMVLMGGSLALHCGGNVDHEPSAHGGSSAAGAPGSGGAPASGGAVSIPAAGAISISSGGTVQVDPGPFECPPAQWDCSATPAQCWGENFLLPDKCACDPTRPLSPKDCVDSDWACLRAEYDSMQRPLTTQVEFECRCVPHQPTCSQTCEKAYGAPLHCEEQGVNPNAVVCGCALIVLR